MCKEEDFLRFMTKNVAKYYPNSLCFDNIDEVKLYNNWFDQNYTNIEILV
jgi:hypothetical protein